MLAFLLRRLLLLLPTLWLIGSVVFLLSRTIPGTFQDRWAEAAQSAIGGPGTAAPAKLATGQEQDLPLFYWSLQSRTDQPLLPAFSWHGTGNQYHRWLQALLQGDLGYSFRDRQPVAAILGGALSHTLLLLGGSLVLTFLLSTELSLALMRAGARRWRPLVLSGLFALDSVPLFLVALLLLVLLAGTGYISWFPLFGLGYSPAASPWEAVGNRVHHLLLPALCLVLSGLPYVTTQLFRFLQQAEQAPYILAARAKGLPDRRVLRRHVLRNAFLPLITLFTGFLPSLISGAVVVEMVFALPGTGRLLADSVLARDYPVVLGLVLLLATVKAASHLLADLLYFAADPRTRLQFP